MDVQDVRMEEIGEHIQPSDIVVLGLQFLILPLNEATKVVIQVVLINGPYSVINLILLLVLLAAVLFLLHDCPVVVPLT